MNTTRIAVLPAALFSLAVAACSSETTSAPPTVDAGFNCKTISANSSKTPSGGDVATLSLAGCTDGKTYDVSCDATTCTCSTNGAATTTLPRADISFAANGSISISSARTACKWP